MPGVSFGIFSYGNMSLIGLCKCLHDSCATGTLRICRTIQEYGVHVDVLKDKSEICFSKIKSLVHLLAYPHCGQRSSVKTYWGDVWGEVTHWCPVCFPSLLMPPNMNIYFHRQKPTLASGLLGPCCRVSCSSCVVHWEVMDETRCPCYTHTFTSTHATEGAPAYLEEFAFPNTYLCPYLHLICTHSGCHGRHHSYHRVHLRFCNDVCTGIRGHSSLVMLLNQYWVRVCRAWEVV